MLTNQPNLQKLFFNNDGLQGDAVALITKLVLGGQQVILEKKSIRFQVSLLFYIYFQDGKTKLRVFEIFNNMMGDAGAIALAPLLAASSQLEEFRMATTRVSKTGGKAVVSALLSCTCLTRLDLSDNTLGDDAGQWTFTMIHKHKFQQISSQ